MSNQIFPSATRALVLNNVELITALISFHCYWKPVIGERATAWGKRTDRSSGTQTLARKEHGIGDALVFFTGFLDLALSHEALEFIVSAQPQHFLPAAGGIPSPESRMNDAEKGFELIGFRARKGRHQLLSDIVGTRDGRRS